MTAGARSAVARMLAVLGLLPASDLWPASLQFVEMTTQAGIHFRYINGAEGRKLMHEPMGSGAAFFDYDNDGYLDLYIVNGTYPSARPGQPPPSSALYHNQADGTFTEVTRAAGVGNTRYGMGAAVGDYDNDGDQDLYVTNFGPNVLYRNNGDNTFTDVSAAAGVDDPGWGSNAAFADYDLDGDLDLYVANYARYDPANNRECYTGKVLVYCAPGVYPGQSGVLYRNEGSSRFSDVTTLAGLSTEAGHQLGAVFADYDDDGDPDLFVANDRQPNFLFSNQGDGTFAEVGAYAGVAYNQDGVAESAMGADWGDYDNDGRQDIAVATFQWRPNTLYHNEGNGFFSYASYAAGIASGSVPYLGMTIAFLDYDNDGYLDLFVANGHLDENVKDYDPATSYAQKNQLFRNQGGGIFREVTDEVGPGFQVERVSHGAVLGDYDNDGDIDVFVSDSDTPHCTLLRNDGGNQNHYLTLRTVGRRSNRDGVGARITVVAGSLRQTKEVRSCYGYLGANDVRLHFGLGSRTQAERVEIRWPSGGMQVLQQVRADQFLTIVEPDR